jgi:hypothetical protein
MAIGGGGGGGAGGRAQGILAGQAFVRIGADNSQLKTVLGQSQRLVLNFSKALIGLGAGLVGLGGAALAPLMASFRGAVAHMGEMKDMADRLGTSTEDLSALGYAAEQTGSSIGDIASAAKFLQRNLVENADEFERLGLNAGELRKMGLADQFQAVADAINKIDDPAERTAAAMKLMGRGGQDMLPMLKELRQLRGRAGLVGAIVSQEDADAADRVGDALDDMQKALKFTFLSVGASLLSQADAIEEWTSRGLEGLQMVRGWIAENRQLVLAVTAGAAAIVALGTTLIGLGASLAIASVALGGLATGIAAVGTVLGVVFSPVGLGIAAVLAVAAAVVYLAHEMGVLEDVGESLADLWGSLSAAFVQTWEGVRDAVQAGDLKLAFEVAVAGMKLVWEEFLLWFRLQWNSVTDMIEDQALSLPKAIEAGLKAGGGVVNRTAAALRTLIGETAARQIRKKDARAARDAALATERDAAKGALDNLTEQAGFVRALQGAMLGLAAGGFVDKIAQNKQLVAATVGELAGVRGQFGGAGLGAALAVGDQSIPKKQLEKLDGIDDKLGKIEKKVGGLKVE